MNPFLCLNYPNILAQSRFFLESTNDNVKILNKKHINLINNDMSDLSILPIGFLLKRVLTLHKIVCILYWFPTQICLDCSSNLNF